MFKSRKSLAQASILIASLLSASLLSTAALGQSLIDDLAGGGAQGMAAEEGASSDLDCFECDLRSKQELLYDEKHEKEKDQVGKGIKNLTFDPDAAPFINVRNLGGTTIFLPIDESIEEIYIGDPFTFIANYPMDKNKRITRKNVIKVAVKNGRTGADSPLTLIGRNGKRHYKFFLSSYNHNESELIPDFWVTVSEPPNETVTMADSINQADQAVSPGNELREDAVSSAKGLMKTEGKPEWLREIEFDPAKIRTDDYEVRINDEAAREVAPDAVWHDGFFTYIKYNEDRSDIIQRPTIQTVIDD